MGDNPLSQLAIWTRFTSGISKIGSGNFGDVVFKILALVFIVEAVRSHVRPLYVNYLQVVQLEIFVT